MKKAYKFLVNFILASIAVALTLCVVFLLNKDWQKAVIVKVGDGGEDTRWQVGDVSLTPWGVELTEVFVLESGLGIEVGEFSASGPIWKVLFGRSLQINEGHLRAFFLDASSINPGDLTASDWQSFVSRAETDPDFWENRVNEILSRLKSEGAQLHIENFAIEGTVLFPGGQLIPVNVLIEEASTVNGLESSVKFLEVEESTGDPEPTSL